MRLVFNHPISRKLWGAIAILLASGATAYGDTVTMQLIAPPAGPYLDHIYTSPYTATINGVAAPVICDDWYTDVSTSTPPWQAVTTNLADIQKETTVSNIVKFGSTPPAGYSGTALDYQKQGYSMLGYMANELMAMDKYSENAKDLSYAIWEVFADPALGQTPFQYLASNSAYASDLAAAESYYADAQAHAMNGLYANVTIYTPNPLSASQEYLYVPEPGTVGLLMIGMFAAFGSRRFKRS